MNHKSYRKLLDRISRQQDNFLLKFPNNVSSSIKKKMKPKTIAESNFTIVIDDPMLVGAPKINHF